LIPLGCTVRIRRQDERLRRFWIPLFLLWPLIVVLFVVLEIPVILACTVLLFIWPRAAVKIALALPATLCLLCQAAGLSIEFTGPGQPEVLVKLS
jgi:hypothetical protein